MLVGASFGAEDLANAIVLALPRGGVPIGAEVARALELPLDVVIVRKLGAPGHREYGIGAVVEGGETWIDGRAAMLTGASERYIELSIAEQLARIDVDCRRYREGRAPGDLEGRTAIVVDDGVATGGTARIVARYLRRLDVGTVTLAVPVAAPDAVDALRNEFDRSLCLLLPRRFAAVGEWYADFDPPSGQEVADLLEAYRGADR